MDRVRQIGIKTDRDKQRERERVSETEIDR